MSDGRASRRSRSARAQQWHSRPARAQYRNNHVHGRWCGRGAPQRTLASAWEALQPGARQPVSQPVSHQSNHSKPPVQASQHRANHAMVARSHAPLGSTAPSVGIPAAASPRLFLGGTGRASFTARGAGAAATAAAAVVLHSRRRPPSATITRATLWVAVNCKPPQRMAWSAGPCNVAGPRLCRPTERWGLGVPLITACCRCAAPRAGFAKLIYYRS